MVALLVLQTQAVEVLFQQEGNTVIDDTEQKQINSKQDPGHPKVYRLILQFVIERRTKIDLEHYPDIIYIHHPGHQFKKATQSFLFDFHSLLNRLGLLYHSKSLLN